MSDSNSRMESQSMFVENYKEKHVVRRFIVLVLLIDLAVSTYVGLAVYVNLSRGFFWPSSGYSLFPIPINPHWFNWGVEPAFRPLSLLEILIFVVFIGYGVWVVWMSMGIIYLVLPWSPRLQSLLEKLKQKIRHLS